VSDLDYRKSRSELSLRHDGEVGVRNVLSEPFEVKKKLYQGSVLSALLFVTIMDAVCSGVMEGLLYGIL
jgi:hypothetical protein